MAHTHKQTDRQTDGHGDSMTDPAQRAESVKKYVDNLSTLKHIHNKFMTHKLHHTNKVHI